MTSPARLKGKKLILSLGTPPVNYNCDATGALYDSEDADGEVITFCDADEGGVTQVEFFTIDAVQSTDLTSFWRMLWANRGDEVPFRFAPHGNDEPTPEQPHLVGTLQLPKRKPPLGGAANSTAVFTARLDVVGEATLDTGESES